MASIRFMLVAATLWSTAVQSDAWQIGSDVNTVWIPAAISSYQEIFNDVLGGIASEVPGVNVVVVDEPSDWVPPDRKGIVLSKPLIDSLDSTNRDKKAVGMAYQTNGFDGVTLDIEPAVWLDSIRITAPRVRHVVFVGWDKNILFDEFDTSSISTNILRKYEDIPTLRVKGGRVAIVFSNAELSLMPKKYLARLLDVAWAEEWVTVTGDYSYGRMGFTLSIIPNYYKYGRQIGRYYNSIEAGGALPVEHVMDVDVSVSIRSARRVGIDTRRHSLKSFAGVFP